MASPYETPVIINTDAIVAEFWDDPMFENEKGQDMSRVAKGE